MGERTCMVKGKLEHGSCMGKGKMASGHVGRVASTSKGRGLTGSPSRLELLDLKQPM